MSRRNHAVFQRTHKGALFAIVFWALLGGCRREEAPESPPPKADASPQEQRGVLVFPDELHSDDESVNNYVVHAMQTCAAGQYDDFRLLWSAREDPLPRQDYEEGWKAVMEVRIKALERVRLTNPEVQTPGEPDTAYAVCAEVTFDPTQKAGQRESVRNAIVLIVREQDQWRLARAPKAVRQWIGTKIGVEKNEPQPIDTAPRLDVDVPITHQP